MDKKQIYIICPRCELNYIQKKFKYCQICKAEMGLIDSNGILLKDEDEDDEENKICPICKTNYCEDGEDCCIVCRKERQSRDKGMELEEWDDDVEMSDIEDDNLDSSLVQFDDEEEEEEEPVETADDGDDFEYVALDDVEDDEDDEEEDDEDDF